MVLSIVMPCYNGEKYIAQAVESVLHQKDTDWELLISDDGSTDGTREFLKKLNDPRIRVFFQSDNLGIFGNLNFLFSKINTPLAYILCQDDVVSSELSIHKIKDEWANQDENIAFIRFNHSSDSKSRLEKFERKVLPDKVHPEDSDLFFYVFGCLPGNLSNVSLRSKIVAQYGGFNPQLPYAGDFEFWSRVGRQAPWRITTTKVVNVRSHPDQASFTLNKRGELLAQLSSILETLYQNLVSAGHNPLALRWFGTLSYVSMHRYFGLRRALKTRSVDYIRIANRTLGQGPYCFSGVGGWLLFVLSLGGKLGKTSSASRLLKAK
jgi:glycosyltransferase involved in cell wall biosynthesis